MSVKPIYASGSRNEDMSHDHEEKQPEGRGRPISRSSKGENRKPNNDPQDRAINFSNLSFLQANVHRTGLYHYQELRGHPLREVFQFLGLAMPNPRFISSKCTGKRKALCVSIVCIRGQTSRVAHHLGRLVLTIWGKGTN